MCFVVVVEVKGKHKFNFHSDNLEIHYWQLRGPTLAVMLYVPRYLLVGHPAPTRLRAYFSALLVGQVLRNYIHQVLGSFCNEV